MPGGRAIKYAEDTLGVHRVHEEAQAIAEELDAARLELAAARRNRVNVEDAYTDEELVFVADMRADNPDLSQTAFDKFIKGKIHQAPDLRKRRGQLADLRHAEELAEAEISRLRNRLEIATARMGELGGYLHYLAEVKAAETASTGLTMNWPPASA